jgi:hypothetical protein
MRLPVQPPPPTEPAEDLYAIRRRGPVPRAGKVVARNVAPLVIPPRRESESEPESLPEAGAAPEADHAAGREGEDRRRVCRRIAQVQVLLDTRSGEDRRRHARRDDDPVTGVDKKV